jgi:hypothetical protein
LGVILKIMYNFENWVEKKHKLRKRVGGGEEGGEEGDW